MTEVDPLAQPVYAENTYKPFGDFTLAEVQARAAELSSAAGWGPTARVGGVARGWSDLARTMSAADAARVRDLGADEAADFAHRLWVVRSLL